MSKAMLGWVFGFWKNMFCANVSLFALVDNRSRVAARARVYRFAKLRNTTVGDYTYIAPESSFNNSTIGKFCSIAWGVKAGMGRHPVNYISTSPVFYAQRNALGTAFALQDSFEEYYPVVIGNDVWIGAETLIMDGVTVGDGAIIAAKSLVNRDVPPYAVVGGIPARVIKYRFEPDIIEKLLEMKWWNWSDDQLRRSAGAFSRPMEFLGQFHVTKK